MRPLNDAWKLLKQTFPNTTNDPPMPVGGMMRGGNPYTEAKRKMPKLMMCPACGGHGQVPVPEGHEFSEAGEEWDPNLRDAPLRGPQRRYWRTPEEVEEDN